MNDVIVGNHYRILSAATMDNICLEEINGDWIAGAWCHASQLKLVPPEVKPKVTKVKPKVTKVKPKITKPKSRNTNSGNSTAVRFPLTVKLQAVGLRKAGYTVRKIAIECKASSFSVNYWLRQHKLGQFNEPIAFQRTCRIIRS